MRFSTWMSVAIAATALAACGGEETVPPVTPAEVKPEPEATAEPTPPPAQDNEDPNRGTLSISDEIRQACGISDAEAYFAYDSANVRPEYRALLRKLSDCFTTGPLKGRLMRLVGHADPRGDDDYNLVLGGQRAESVKRVLVTEAMEAARVETTSRGEMDATGTDESTWTQDRRVDVVLGN